MESRLISVTPFAECPIAPFEAQQIADVIDSQLASLLRRRAQLVEHDAVAPGDVVRLRLDGPTAHLTRDEVQLVVGQGHFDRDLESLLPGQAVGARVELEHPAGAVQVEVLRAQGREVPAAADDLVRELTEGADATVAAFRQRIAETERARQLDEHISRATSALLDDVIDTSELAIADADREAIVAAEVERCRQLSAAEGLDFETMTAEQLRERVAVDSIDAFLHRARAHSDRRISQALLGAHCSGRPAERILVDDVDEMLDAAWNCARAHVERELRDPQKDR